MKHAHSHPRDDNVGEWMFSAKGLDCSKTRCTGTYLAENKDEVLKGQHVCSLCVLNDHHQRPHRSVCRGPVSPCSLLSTLRCLR